MTEIFGWILDVSGSYKEISESVLLTGQIQRLSVDSVSSVFRIDDTSLLLDEFNVLNSTITTLYLTWKFPILTYLTMYLSFIN